MVANLAVFTKVLYSGEKTYYDDESMIVFENTGKAEQHNMLFHA